MRNWQVFRSTHPSDQRRWLALRLGGVPLCAFFPSWREAYDFADREARR